MMSRTADTSVRLKGSALLSRVVGVAFLTTPLSVLLLTGLAIAQGRPSLEVTLDWLASKIPLAQPVDGQGDRREYQPVEMTTCDIRLRETIHAKDGPLVTEHSIPLAEVTTTVRVGDSISLRTPKPTIVSRTARPAGEPSVEHGDSFQLRFPEQSLAGRVQRALRNAISWCRPRSKEPF